MYATCERVHRELSRALGSHGSEALFARALSQSQLAHPSLCGVRLGRQAKPDSEGLGAMVSVHGEASVIAALDALLETWLTLLGRLIGDDMAARLVNHTAAAGTDDNGEDR